jgi:hypothetical protein
MTVGVIRLTGASDARLNLIAPPPVAMSDAQAGLKAEEAAVIAFLSRQVGGSLIFCFCPQPRSRSWRRSGDISVSRHGVPDR